MAFIPIDRDDFLDDLWLDETFTRGQAWLDLQYLANYRDGHIRVRGNLIPVLRGQVGWSQNRLSDRWSWSRTKVNKFLDDLEYLGKIKQQKTRLTSLITIANYPDPSEERATERPQKSNREATEKQQKDPIEEVNKAKKDNNLGATKTKRGTRLPSDWILPDEWRQWALENKPGIDCEAEAEKFRDYWISKPGQQAVKLDWLATWRNWVRNSKGGNYGAGPQPRGSSSAVDRVRRANSEPDYQQGSIIDITPEVG